MSRRVAFQGERGAFSEDAIAGVWPNESQPVPLSTFEDVVHAVATRRADAGVLPIENSIAGTVSDSIAALAAGHAVRVVGETIVRITQCLMAPRGATIDAITTVESHPVALAQCRGFLRRHRTLVAVETCDTAGAARAVAAANDPRRAAIASHSAARQYGLTILAEGIEDNAENSTRFVIIAPASASPAPVTWWRRFHAVRGATSVDTDDPGTIRSATRELLLALIERNYIRSEQVVSALFSTTGDLTSEFPARAARDLGWTETPLMCMSEIPVPGALEGCIRVLLHVELEHPRARMLPVYLRRAQALRRDITPALAAAPGFV